MRGRRPGGTEVARSGLDGTPIPTGPLGVPGFLALAVELAWALDEWHRAHGVHGALCPDAFRVDESGSARIVPPDPDAAPLPEYTAPEQTGRVDPGVDGRTDLYALGTVLYRLLTGKLPLRAGTPAQWRQAHLTRPPTPPAELVTAPPALNEILLLLLNKVPDARYQTARGLALDLGRCRDEPSGAATGTPLLLRTRDVPHRLVLSGRAYGREARSTRLPAAYERVAAGGPAELVSVTGDPGLGKSTVVAEFADGVVRAGGRTLRAACPPERTAPYAAVAQLLDDLAAQLADVAPEQRAWVAEAVGGCGTTLAELAPGLRPLFAGPPPRDAVGPAARHRLHLAVRRLFGALNGVRWAGTGTPAGPVVVVIRDAQWADPATVDLLRYLLSGPDSPPVLMVVTYRQGDVRSRHPLQALLGDAGILSSTVTVRPLPDSALADLLADTLAAGMRDAAKLGRAVADRTGSSPLMVGQFLHHLVDRHVLAFAPEGPTWQWQHRALEEVAPVTDVVELVGPRIARLPDRTRDLLETAAMLGVDMDRGTLATAAGTDAAKLADLVAPAVRADLLVARAHGGYRWRHEQLRRVVLGSVGDTRQTELHLAAGRALHRSGRLFEAVSHLNLAVELLVGTAESRWLADLNLAAGRRATRVGADAEAREYFLMGLDLIDPGARHECPDLVLALHLESARVEHAAGNTERAERLLEVAAEGSADPVGRARALGLRAVLRCGSGDRVGGFQLAVDALAVLGIALPRDPADWPKAAAEAVDRLRERPLDAAPPTTAPAVAIVTDLVADLAYLGALDDADMGGAGNRMLLAAGVELALDRGPGPSSPFTFAAFGSTLAKAGHDPDAQRYIRQVLRLLDAMPDARYRSTTRSRAAIVGSAWLDSPASAARELREAYLDAVEEGNPVAAQYTGVNSIAYRYSVATPIDGVADELAECRAFAQRHGGNAMAMGMLRLLDTSLRRLRGEPDPTQPPTGDEAALDDRLMSGACGFFSLVALTPALAGAYVFGDYGAAARLAPAVERAAAFGPPSYLHAEATFFQALTHAARADEVGSGGRAALLADLAARQAVLDDLAGRGPGLFAARALLLSAERSRIAGDVDLARTRYDRAIIAARGYGFVRLEGIAAERAGRYALVRGDTVEGLAYLRRARACFATYGAPAKVAHVDGLIAEVAPAAEARTLDQLDVLTMVKAFQAISGELRRERLVGVLLELLVRYSSAERGCLLLADGADLRLSAEAHADRRRIRVDSAPAGELDGQVPVSVVEHVRVTRQAMIGDGEEDCLFPADPYLAEHRPGSVLCAPILRRDSLVGVLYLEHRRLRGSFNAASLELLEVLCAQAAIALDNAAVHAQLTEASRILDVALDAEPFGVIVLNADLTVRRASSLAAEITGIPISPRTPLLELFDVLSPTDVGGVPLHLDPGFAAFAATTTEPIHREIVVVAPNGQRRHLSTTAVPMRDEVGGLAGVLVLVAPADAGKKPG